MHAKQESICCRSDCCNCFACNDIGASDCCNIFAYNDIGSLLPRQLLILAFCLIDTHTSSQDPCASKTSKLGKCGRHDFLATF
eukprot:2894654-Amphidinium_carterae.1